MTELPGWRDRRHRRPLVAVLVVADLALPDDDPEDFAEGMGNA
ncbi:hypothetical protein [Amycolatopsis sp. NPDC051102]